MSNDKAYKMRDNNTSTNDPVKKSEHHSLSRQKEDCVQNKSGFTCWLGGRDVTISTEIFLLNEKSLSKNSGID